jgi:sugar phosphate isomerase/epimerase
MDIIPPLAIGVCSWSLQVTSVPELERFLAGLGVNHVQIACGDPHHASWTEGDAMPERARAASFVMTGAMLGFPGEDYTSPETIRLSGGFGPVERRRERLECLSWGLARTRSLGLTDLSLHAGFIPPPGDAERPAFMATLAEAARMADQAGVTLAFETGQETAETLRQTLDELASPRLRINFDPANMLLYDMGDPIAAVELLAAYIRSVHAKDAIRPSRPGAWGTEVPLGQGEVNIPKFVRALVEAGYRGPICVEREVGNQSERFADIAHGIRLLREVLAAEQRG